MNWSAKVRPWLGALSLVLLASCSQKAERQAARAKPTAKEIKELRANFKDEDVPAPTIPSLNLLREAGLKETAADALARIGDDAVPALIQALRHENRDVRIQAARALARIGSRAKQSVPALVNALYDVDETVRRTAARALGQLGPEARAAIPDLVAVLEEDAMAGPSTSPSSSRGEPAGKPAPTHRLASKQDYYLDGATTGQEPDGSLAAGTEVTLVRIVGTQALVRWDDEQAYVDADSLDPIVDE